jgi:FtsP/CotA-like multicopper oxidase with cupredoxin domain
MIRDPLVLISRPRRGLLPHAVGVALLGAAACAGAAGSGSTPAPARAAMAAPAARAQVDTGYGLPFREPRVIRTGSDGILRATLRVDTATLYIPTLGHRLLRSWTLVEANGVSYADSANTTVYPGPTFRVSVGDSVRILLVNNLPAPNDENACMPYRASLNGRDTVPECFHGINGTNIHYHGFHISPGTPADNVLLEIEPGESFQYAFRIPQNQSPGTHWYHPHKHGSVAMQVNNGMSGAFIIQGGGLDSISAGLTPLTGYLPMVEHLVAIQQVRDSLGLQRDTVADPPNLVNGLMAPKLTMRPGEVQRWRMVNENVSKTANQQLLFAGDAEVPTLYDVARDGVSFAPANYSPQRSDDALIMAPGNRMDVFVKAPASPGTYHLRAVPINAMHRVSRRLRQDATPQSSVPTNLVQVVVLPDTGDGKYVKRLPDSLLPLPAFLQNLVSPRDTAQRIVFSEQGVGGQGDFAYPPLFYLGTAASPWERFNDSVPLVTMPLGATQRWKVSNRSKTGINHPFHIHINPFQVEYVHVPADTADSNYPLYVEVNRAARAGHPYWFDTFPLPLPGDTSSVEATEGYIVIRQAYEDFTGAYVMHCHILGHEERGMMSRVDVTRTGRPEPAPAAHGHRH